MWVLVIFYILNLCTIFRSDHRCSTIWMYGWSMCHISTQSYRLAWCKMKPETKQWYRMCAIGISLNKFIFKSTNVEKRIFFARKFTWNDCAKKNTYSLWITTFSLCLYDDRNKKWNMIAIQWPAMKSDKIFLYRKKRRKKNNIIYCSQRALFRFKFMTILMFAHVHIYEADLSLYKRWASHSICSCLSNQWPSRFFTIIQTFPCDKMKTKIYIRTDASHVTIYFHCGIIYSNIIFFSLFFRLGLRRHVNVGWISWQHVSSVKLCTLI